jgi:hypothetical protein
LRVALDGHSADDPFGGRLGDLDTHALAERADRPEKLIHVESPY